MTNLLISFFIKDKDNVKDAKVRNAYGVLGGIVGIGCNIMLFICKFFAGIITGAISITADAFNNLADAASSIITLIGFHMAGKPADEDHPFGHGRMEYISGLIVALAILMMGVELFKTAVSKIVNPEEITFQAVSIIILVLSILVKFWMSVFNNKIGDKIQSETMKATAMDSLNDCISTAAVLGGMLIFHFMGYNLDGYIGIFVACFVLWGGYGAVRDTLDPLLGETPDPELVENIEDMVMRHDMIIGIHDMIVHDYGPGRRIVSLHAEVPYNVDILEAHDLIDHVEMRLMQEYRCEATIHMDPVVTDDEETTKSKQLVETLIHNYDETLSIHDFRMVKGKTHTNVIFDMVIPYGENYQVNKIVKDVRQKIQQELPGNHFAVIKVDRNMVM
ncbi:MULTISPECIES: cation diffusion facilitator family transporter [Anaerostipes]|uniref:cation diffusion facilitator family transporter n=1 Tax=Anaerostipes TaxID=207244 RepID=UPI000952F82C|nr:MULTISPECIES: cation diffusion facilitator family transporter [unclassified Anaerostipes]MCI5623326.1 cation diffusion facilitator family transporter [Anaerostipes sp.]OLR60193.1 cation diffusion facilitator family transporter [Anaerostipes sp. 494a]